eukprot:scaffold916_cov516-Prasinococcus_capsulatus_cf.AAC.21
MVGARSLGDGDRRLPAAPARIGVVRGWPRTCATSKLASGASARHFREAGGGAATSRRRCGRRRRRGACRCRCARVATAGRRMMPPATLPRPVDRAMEA